MTAKRCKSPASFLDNTDGVQTKLHTSCVLTAGHDGQHIGAVASGPRPRWDYDHEVVDMRSDEATTSLTTELDQITATASEAAGSLIDVANTASTLKKLRLSRNHEVELSIQLLERLRKVSDRLGELDLALSGGGILRSVSSEPSGEACVEVAGDMHESSPVVAESEPGRSDAPAMTVQEAVDTAPGVGAAAEAGHGVGPAAPSAAATVSKPRPACERPPALVSYCGSHCHGWCLLNTPDDNPTCAELCAGKGKAA